MQQPAAQVPHSAIGRLATDVGGTFTDLVYFDEGSGELTTAKVLTTPADQSVGVIDAIRASGIDAGRVGLVVHGGTTVINAITERKGVKTALVTTRGFRDVLEIARGNRPDLYNLRFFKEQALVPRDLRFEVGERVAADGCVLEPLDRDDLEDVAQACARERVGAVAVSYLHSYAQPDHEHQTAQFLRERLPGVAVTASHEISREWREYERSNTAVLNAYVQPIVERYFDGLERALAGLGVHCPLAAMQSNGGTTSFGWAKRHPITLLESGPAAGCNAAGLVGKLCGQDKLIYLDIGGTTAKCTTIEGGRPNVSTSYRLEHSRVRHGYPLQVPVVDIVEIGAGGGSIAWMDAAGMLRVGPLSAGADPGPACYGLGGAEPTVTDAKLLTGVLNPDNFAHRQMRLDAGKAAKAMSKIAQALGCDVQSAAVSVIRTAEEAMIDALRLVSIQRGHDPRDFSLVIGGGGGPMHAAYLGRELGVREIIVPFYPGLFSAWGMLATAPRRDFTHTLLQDAKSVPDEQVERILAMLREQGIGYFAQHPDVKPDMLEFEAAIDFRYAGQEHAVTVPIDWRRPVHAVMLADFHRLHEKKYTFSLPGSAVECVNYRLTVTACVPAPRIDPLDSEGRSLDLARRGTREVHFGEDGLHSAAVWERAFLPRGAQLSGPCIIEEETSTTAVHPGQSVTCDQFGFLHILEYA